MERIFGTEGARGMLIRCFDHETAEKTGITASAVLSSRTSENPLITVGHDNGVSAENIADSVCTGICSAGINAEKLGLVPSSAVSCLVRLHNADAGIMITSTPDNKYCGIRLYSGGGHKISDEAWEEIEQLLFRTPDRIGKRLRDGKGGVIVCENALDEYIDFICKSADFSGLKVAVCCTDSRNTGIAVKALYETGAEIFSIFENNETFDSDGYTKTTAEKLSDFVVEKNLDCGFVFGSDCERCIAVDEKGNITDTDSLGAVFAEYYKENNLLRYDTFVATSAVGTGFLEFAENSGISVITGGRNERSVVARMTEGGYNLGADRHGRIIFYDDIPVGDGIFTAVRLLAVIKSRKRPLSEISGKIRKYPQVMINVRISPEYKEIWKNDSVITDIIEDYQRIMGKKGRITVRENPKDSAVSVTAEGEDFTTANNTAMEIARIIRERTL
ncbi:MAG: hypothetical protein K2J08_11930 [Ruminococcus sp.]|nr:hypothetical protein [Ruminococcus sp.]